MRACALAVALVLAFAGCGGGGTTTTTGGGGGGAAELGPSFDDIGTLPGAQNTPPPFNSGLSRLQRRLRAIGLPALGEEGQVVHIHQHLDLYVNGRRVAVPPNIGIGQGFISPLHTHDATGVIHVESPTASSFGLGQFFAVWGVPLSARNVGAVKGAVRAWVNGKPLEADPTRIVLAPRQEIVIALGPAPKKIPSTYAFPEGL